MEENKKSSSENTKEKSKKKPVSAKDTLNKTKNSSSKTNNNNSKKMVKESTNSQKNIAKEKKPTEKVKETANESLEKAVVVEDNQDKTLQASDSKKENSVSEEEKIEKNDNLKIDDNQELTNTNDKKPKNKKHNKSLLLFILILSLISIGIYIYCVNDKNILITNKKTYPVLSDTYNFGDNQTIIDYVNGYFVSLNGNKSVLLDNSGEVIEGHSFDSIDKFGNMILECNAASCSILNNKLELMYDKVTIGDRAFTNNTYYVFTKDKKAYMVTENGKIIFKDYDEIIFQDEYILCVKDNKISIYDNKLNLLLNNVSVVKTDSMEYSYFNMNSNFILLKVSDGYKVYFAKNHKLSDTYEYITFNNDYVAYTYDGKIYVKNKNGKIINTYSTVYEKYLVASDSMIAVSSCSYDELCEADLYDVNGNKLTKESSKVLVTSNSAVVVSPSNNYVIYNGNKVIYDKTLDENTYIYQNMYGNYEITTKDNNYIIDNNGKKLLEECPSVSQYDNGIFICSPIQGINYIYASTKKLIDKSYSDINYAYNNYIVVKNNLDKYGMYDVYGNRILEEKYDNISLYDNYVAISLNGKMYFKLINNTSKDEYLVFVANDNNIENVKEEINYNSINVNDVIKKYNLNALSNVINNNKDLFVKYAYHVINNKNTTDKDKGIMLKMFNVIIDYNKYADISKLFTKIDEFKIKVYNNRTSDIMDGAAGQYYSSDNEIRILKEYYDYAIEHELMHMISFSIKNDSYNNYAYTCSNKVLDYKEVYQLSFDSQTKCSYGMFNDYNSFLEEAGAEYFTTVIYKQKNYETYVAINVAYNLLQYILDDDFYDIQYAPSKEIALYKLLNTKLGYNFDKSKELIDSLDSLFKLQFNQFDNKLEEAYAVSKTLDNLIDAYIKKTGNSNWQENEYFYSSVAYIFSLLDNGHDNLAAYLAKNKTKTIKYYDKYKDFSFYAYESSLIERTKLSNAWNNASYLYFMRDNGDFCIYMDVSSNDKSYVAKIYFDKKGSYVDTKVLEK